MRAATVSAVLVLGMPPMALAQSGACYDVALGPWSSIEGTASTPEQHRPPPDESPDSLSYLFPPRIRLTDEPARSGRQGSLSMVVPAGALPVPKSHLMWERIDTDRIRVSAEDWTSGVRGWLTGSEDRWSGTLQSWSHQLGLERYDRPIRLDLVDCATPPPVPASADPPAPRAVPSASGPPLRLGEPVPEGYELRPVRSFELVANLDPGGYWAGADSVLVVRNEDERVKWIEVRYPQGFEGAALRGGLFGDFGQGVADRPWASWENRTTRGYLQLARSEGRTRVILIDPRMEFRP